MSSSAPTVFVLLLGAALAVSGSAPETTRAAPLASVQDTAAVRLLILGTFHFANPGQDAINPEVPDVLTPEKQREIREVVDALARFRPTKIALEWPYENAARLDSLYHAYRGGAHELTRNERQQLGFRLAAELGHERVYAVDWRNRFGMDRVMAWAAENDPSFIRYFEEFRDRILSTSDSLHRTETVGGALRHVNRAEDVRQTFAPYMRMAVVGADSVYIGMEPVVNYYERNLRIFVNIHRIAEPGDRVLAIFGSGHAPFLRQFAEGHPDVELVDPLEYLPGGD